MLGNELMLQDVKFFGHIDSPREPRVKRFKAFRPDHLPHCALTTAWRARGDFRD
jgi:hypothetical protein